MVRLWNVVRRFSQFSSEKFPTKDFARLLTSSASTKRKASTGENCVGFIGLGNMGLPMSINLAKEHSVLAFDTDALAMKIAQEHGIHPAASVDEIGSSKCSIIFTMLPGCYAVDQVTLSLLESAPSNSSIIFVDCSTVRLVSCFVLVAKNWMNSLDQMKIVKFACLHTIAYRFILLRAAAGMKKLRPLGMQDLMPPFPAESR